MPMPRALPCSSRRLRVAEFVNGPRGRPGRRADRLRLAAPPDSRVRTEHDREPEGLPGGAVTVDILSLGSRGEGVGRTPQGQAVFVHGTVPGDRAEVEVTEVHERYLRGELVRLLASSPDRVVPACPSVLQCGGCPLMLLTPEAQRREKMRRLSEILKRIGGFPSAKVDPFLPVTAGEAAGAFGYRAKAAMPVGRATHTDRRTPGLIVGFYGQGSHDLVEASHCLVAHPLVRRGVVAARDVAEELFLPPYDERSGQGFLRHILARVAVSTGELMVTLVTRDPSWPGFERFGELMTGRLPELTTLTQSINPERTNRVLGRSQRILAGPPYITEHLAGLTFHLSPHSFFQVNPPVAEAMYLRAIEELRLQGGERVVDAHTGVGALALLARRSGAGTVRGFETVEGAVRDAEANARRNHLDVRFEVGRAEDLYPRHYRAGEGPDRVLFDPPRTGCAPELLTAVRRAPPKRLVYISCAPETLARDLSRLCEDGTFVLERVIPVDLFPHTAHLESIAVLRRGGEPVR